MQPILYCAPNASSDRSEFTGGEQLHGTFRTDAAAAERAEIVRYEQEDQAAFAQAESARRSVA